MELKRLEALVALAREGTVSAAAQSLGCGQPTVSHHLHRLEEETGSVLVQRVGRGVRLTPDGVRLAARGEEILGLLRRAETELDTATTLAGGHVRLAAFPSAMSALMPPLITRLRTSVPGLTLDLVEAEPPEAATMLRAGRVDVAVTFAFAGQKFGDDIVVEHLGWDALHLVEPRCAPVVLDGSCDGGPVGPGDVGGSAVGGRARGHGGPDDGGGVGSGGDAAVDTSARLDGSGRERSDVQGAGLGGALDRPAAASVRPERLRELRNQRWIAGCERCRTGLLDLCASVGVAPDIGFASDDVVAVQALVAAGFGVTLVPELALQGHRDPGVVTRPVVGAGRELQVATHGAPPRPAAVEEVVQTLLDLARA